MWSSREALGQAIKGAVLWFGTWSVRIAVWPADDWITLSLSSQQLEGAFNESGMDKSSEKKEMGSAVHMLCPRCGGPPTSTAPKIARLRETFTFKTLGGLLLKGRIRSLKS